MQALAQLKLHAVYPTATAELRSPISPLRRLHRALCRELHMVMVFLGLLVNTGEVAAALALDILQASAPSRMPACGLPCSLKP